MRLQDRNAAGKLVEGILWVFALVQIYPVYLVIISSIKSKAEFAVNPLGIPKNITFEHFKTAIDSMHFLRSFFNSALITAVSVVCVILLSSAAAYAISRKNNRFYNLLFIFFLSGLIIPFQMTMIPLYKIMISFHFINTYHGLIILYVGANIPFSLFIFSGFIRSVPRELEEAAFIDGCGIYKTFYKIVFPLLRPAVATISILSAFNVWNDFIMPLLFLQKTEMKTLVVQLNSFFGQYFNNWSPVFAAILLIVLPVILIYIFAQRYIIKGITAGGLKG